MRFVVVRLLNFFPTFLLTFSCNFLWAIIVSRLHSNAALTFYTGTQSEDIIGEAFAGRRQDVILATKVGMKRGDGPNDKGSSRIHILQEIEGSLRRLRTDYIDLYQIHAFDPATPLEETLRTLDNLIVSGKVRYIGASNYAAWQLMKATRLASAVV